MFVECCFIYLVLKKIICKFKKYRVYDEKNVFNVGDKVCIIECVFKLKIKCWEVLEV